MVVVVVANAVGNVVLGYGMREIGDITSYSPLDILRFGIASLTSPWVMAGVGLLAIFFAAHTLLLSWVDLSYVLVVTSVGYVLVAVLSAAVLGEEISLKRWAGTALIALGVAVVHSTPESTVSQE